MTQKASRELIKGSTQSDLPYWVALSRIEKMGAMQFKRFYSFFDSMEKAWRSRKGDLLKAGLKPEMAQLVISERTTIDPEQEMELLKKHNVHAITIFDSRYPPLLKEIYNPPGVLFVRGCIENLNTINPLAIVGSRLMSPYGHQVLKDLIPKLSDSCTIISGLALGVDAQAHKETVKNGGRTIAVLGSGADDASIQPRANYRLAQQILENIGTIISEYPIGTLPQPFHYPVRNRIISGLSRAVLVIEAAKKSGALITAYTALEQNRDVYAIPGSVYNPLSEGTNELLSRGARVITSAEEIKRLYGVEQIDQMSARGGSAYGGKALPANEEEEKILNLPFLEPLHIDEIIKRADLSSQKIASTLTIMELQGKIKHLGGQIYTK